jgi:beta-fructofuranosidase
VPEFHARMNWPSPDGVKEGAHGGEFFAPESLFTPDGRRVMWAWIQAFCHKRVKDPNLNQPTLWESMSLPRELSLP